MQSGKRSKPMILLPNPKNLDGYTEEELSSFMSKEEINAFYDWMTGQGVGVVKDKTLFFTGDVTRFLQEKRFKK